MNFWGAVCYYLNNPGTTAFSIPSNIIGAVAIVLMLLILKRYSLKELDKIIPLDGSSWVILRLIIKVKEIQEDRRRADGEIPIVWID
jgi:hypothetical protein